jgi:hypothetical protein
MRRILMSAAIGLAFALPASVAVIGTSSQSAFAGTPKSVACKGLTGTVTGSITISKCKPANTKYKSASGLTSSLETGGAFTWSPSGKTSASDNTTVSSPGQGGCAAGSTEEDATGSVTSISKGNTYTPIGQVISLRVCVDSAGNITLVPGTKAEI